MTQDVLSAEELGFATIINTSRASIPRPESSTDLTLATYLDALTHGESLSSSDEQLPIKAPSRGESHGAGFLYRPYFSRMNVILF